MQHLYMNICIKKGSLFGQFIKRNGGNGMSLMKERALEYLVDNKGEGGLVCELDRSPMVDQPTIIIGLGGTGIDAMLHAKYVIQRKMTIPEGEKRPRRLAFIAVDTDENAFKEKRIGDVRVDPSERVLIDENRLATFMKDHGLIPHGYLRDWLCKGINADAITFGAGGIRQCGRFMFINKATNFINRLTQAAAETWGGGMENGAPFQHDTKYNVYIFTGVSGGTGSGTFLDTAFLVRELFKNHIHRDVQIRGFIFMPDVNLCKVKDAATRAYIPVNGYAALRELDFWMNAERGRAFKQQYTPTVSVNTLEKPFDLCYLVSPNGSLPADYDNCMSTTGEALMNILSAPQNSGAGGLNFESYVTNLGAMLNGAALKTIYSGNYVYASMGMDEQRLHLDTMANYLAYYLLMKVNALFNREPVKEEVEELFAKELKLDARRGLQRLFDKSIPARPFNNVVRTLDDFKIAISQYNRNTVLESDILQSELETWVTQCEVTYNKNSFTILEDCMKMLVDITERKFTSLDYGPYYVHKLIHNIAVGKPDLLKKIEEQKNEIAAFLATATDREDKLKNLAQEALEAARRNKHIPLIAKPKFNDYVEAVFRYNDHRRYTKFASIAFQFYNNLLQNVTDYNNLIVERFSTLLENLTDVFKRNSDIITNVEHDGTTHTWSIGNFSQIQSSIDAALANLRNAGKENALVVEFLKMMLENKKTWVGDEGGLGISFSKFVSEKFHDLMNQSMEQSYMQMENLTSAQQLIDHMQNTVLPKLKGGAKVLYTPDAMLSPLENSPQRAMIAIPSTATNIAYAVNQYIKSTNLPCDIVSSKRQGSLFWFQSSFGLPLYAHDSLRTYQTAHDVYGQVDSHLGRYLIMSAEENWLELLPPIMPEATWKYAKYSNPKWEKRNAATRVLMKEAMKYNLIKPLETGSAVKVLGVVNKDKFTAFMDQAPIGKEDGEKIMKGGAAEAANLKIDVKRVKEYIQAAEQFSQEAWAPVPTLKFKSDIFTTLMNGELVEKNDEEKRELQILSENVLLTPDLASQLAEQMKLVKELEKVLMIHKKYVDLIYREDGEREDFANALIYGLYRPTAPKVFQLDGADAGIPACMLMTISDYKLAPANDPFYALFRKYVTFDETLKDNMVKIVKMREKMMNNEMNTGNTARYARYANMVRGIDKAMEARLKQIDMDVTFDNPEIRDFYIEIRKIFRVFLPDAGFGGMM